LTAGLRGTKNYRVSRKNTPAHLIHEFVVRIGSAGENKALAMIQDAGLTLPQMIGLGMLRQAGQLPITALSTRLGLSMSATSALVQRLVEQDLVARTEDPSDRRQKQVTLTPKGAEFMDKAMAERTAAITRSIAGLPEELRKEFFEVLGRVVAHLRGGNP
jgi:DNA-binding MarR family transcriptional regulator